MPLSIARRRLAAQHVARPALASPRAVVEHLGAVQAQDLAAATWALGLRLRGRATLARVQRAIERGEVLRTWPMRGTLHFVSARDARWIVGLLAHRAIAKSSSRRRELDVTDATLANARRVLSRALVGGGLARPDAYAALERAGVRTSGQRGIHILAHLAQEGMLCVGPHEGKQPTFALLDELAPARGRTGSLATLAARFVTSHGPASVADLAWWTGTTLTQARDALAEARGVRDTSDGWTATRPRIAREPSPTAHLLPAFDELAVAYKDRSAALGRVGHVANPQIGLLSPSVVVDGEMVGTWGRTFEKDCVHVTLKPLVEWSGAEREAVAAAADRFAAFLGRELRLTTARAAGRSHRFPRA